MLKLLYISMVFILISGFVMKPKKFPEISYTTSEGKVFTNADFIGKETVVILFHLGCPPAMGLLKDLETLNSDTTQPRQIIGISENTRAQIEAFNSTTKNYWSDIRNSFQLQPVEIPLIGECEAIEVEDESDGAQCRILAKKVNTNSSPTLVYVNTEGNIEEIKKGYLSDEAPLEERISFLFGG